MYKRKTNSLYGKVIKEALTNEQPWRRSEDLPEYRKFYVNEELIQQIHTNENHLIIGRRGTGKTHLLGSFNEYIRDESPNEISLMISLMNSIPKTPPSTDLETIAFTNKRMAKLMFEGFLNVFFKKFLHQVDKRINESYIDKHKQVNSLLTQLLEVIELGEIVNISKEVITTLNEHDKGDTKMNGHIEFGIKNFVPKFTALSSLNTSIDDNDISKKNTKITSILKINHQKVRLLISEIMDLLEIETLYILIDEWMELDKRTPSGIQPIFAQYLKETFFNSNKFSVKIATIWHETTLYDKNDMRISKGIQLKHDIVRAVNLDTDFLSTDEEVYEFCKKLLFKRLVYACEALKALELDNNGVDDIFITELFDSKDNFKAFITASHGIPRDLMEIFQKSSVIIKRDFQHQCINSDLIFHVSKLLYLIEKRKNLDPASLPQKLLTLIDEYMEKEGRRLFIVNNEFVRKSDALRKLIDEEIIHQIPSAATPRKIYNSYKSYLIDFGNYVDWVKSRKKDISRLLNEFVLAKFPNDFEENIDSYIIDISSIEDNNIKCSSCGNIFSIDHPVYLKFNSCPKCSKEIITKP